MDRDAIGWVGAVVGDLLFRSPPPGIVWRADRRTPPLSVRFRSAEEDFATLVYPDDEQALATVQFAAEAQQAVVARQHTPLPACREHRVSLDPYVNEEGQAGWRCSHGDVHCAVGDFPETLWPPQWWERLDPPLVSDRLERRGLRYVTLGVDDGPDGQVVSGTPWLWQSATGPYRSFWREGDSGQHWSLRDKVEWKAGRRGGAVKGKRRVEDDGSERAQDARLVARCCQLPETEGNAC